MACSSASVMVAGSDAGVGAGGSPAFSDGGGGVRRTRAVCGNARVVSSVVHCAWISCAGPPLGAFVSVLMMTRAAVVVYSWYSVFVLQLSAEAVAPAVTCCHRVTIHALDVPAQRPNSHRNVRVQHITTC